MTGLTKIKRFSIPADPSSLIDGRTGAPKRVPPKVRKAVRLLLEGSATTITAAAGQVGMHPDSLSRAFRQPHVKLYIDERTRALLDSGKTIAAARLMELVRAQSEHVSLDASKLALSINGIKPAEHGVNISINNNVTPGYIIDLRNPRDALPSEHPLTNNPKVILHEDRDED